MLVKTDRDFYVLLGQILVRRDELIERYELKNYPMHVLLRISESNSLKISQVYFRCGTKQLRRPTLKDVQHLGLKYHSGMLREIGAIARLDQLIVKMLTRARKSVQRSTELCLDILTRCELYDIRPGDIFYYTTCEFEISGDYSPLPYLAREIGIAAIDASLQQAFRLVSVCNGERRVRIRPEGITYYSPGAGPNIYIRRMKGVMPPSAEWGFYFRKHDKDKVTRYYFRRRLRSRAYRVITKIERGITLFHLRRFRIKHHSRVFMNMSAFVSFLMKARERHRPLWNLVKTAPVANREVAFLTRKQSIDHAPHLAAKPKIAVDYSRNYVSVT